MRKFLASLLCVMMVFCMMPGMAFAEGGTNAAALIADGEPESQGSSEVTVLEGEGTETDPYLIKTIGDLIFFRDHVNEDGTTYNAEGVYVALGADIDMAGVDWNVNIGDDCNATFNGIFDGKGHKISNLTSTETMQKSDGYICSGLFGAIYGSAVVKNLTIENATINTGEFTGNNAGVVVGFAYNAIGTIENVKVCGDVTVNASKVDGTGAIVGYAYGGNIAIENCSVDCSENSSINGQAYVGGIIGYAGGKTTINGSSVNNVTVNSKCCAGGVAGILCESGEVYGCTVKNVDLIAVHENWLNSAAAVVGSNAGSVTISECTIDNVTANGVKTDVELGCKYVYKPTAPLPAYQAKIGSEYYESLEAAVAAVHTVDATAEKLPEATTITLLADTKAAFDIGNSSGNAAKNVVIDLNGKTLTLGPAVGSEGTKSQGIRVLAYSQAHIQNGTIVGSDLSEDNVQFMLANYGTLTLHDVDVNAGAETTCTINNRGNLTLSGTTDVETGKTGWKLGVTNDPYNYYYTNRNAVLNIADASVNVGVVNVENDAPNGNNTGVPELNISAGTIAKITVDEGTLVPAYNITGGTFGANPKAFVGTSTNIYLKGSLYYVGTAPAHSSGMNTWTKGDDGIYTESYVAPSYSGGGYVSIEKPEITADAGADYDLSILGTTLTITAKDGYELVDVTLNGVSKGAVTELKGLKTSDKVVIVTKAIGAEEPVADEAQLVARSQMSKVKGKKAIKVYWFNEDGSELTYDGYEIFRSTKRFKGYGTKPIFETEREAYWNTDIELGTKYYYKVRGYNVVDGEKEYSEWSLKAWRVAE